MRGRRLVEAWRRLRIPSTPFSATAGKPLPAEWLNWLRLNRDRGCDLETLRQRAEAEGFEKSEIAAALRVDPSEDASSIWVEPPLTNRSFQPRAWRLDTPLAQIYEIPGLLSRLECDAVMYAIDQGLVPSTVTTGPLDYRTSQTCHLAEVAPELTKALDDRFAALFGVDPSFSEPLQGQRYEPGQYFKAHTDWFTPGTDEFDQHALIGGQRTWTLMVYLNAVDLGGETVFHRLGRSFAPTPGMALAWNNLHSCGEPNHETIHEAMPVEKGLKYVITKWFREFPGR